MTSTWKITMWHAISDEHRISNYQHVLEQALAQYLNERILCTVSGAGNRYEDEIHYSSVEKIWYSYQLQERKHFNAFGCKEPKVNAKLAIESEINLPRSGVSKAMAAGFAENDNQEIILFHRGKIRGGKELFFQYFQGEIVGIDGENCAVVAHLNCDDTAQQVCKFVRSVLSIKEQIKSLGK